MAKTRSMPASPGTPLTLDAVLKTPKRGKATPKPGKNVDTPMPAKAAKKSVEETPVQATPKPSSKAKAATVATPAPKTPKAVSTPKPKATPAKSNPAPKTPVRASARLNPKKVTPKTKSPAVVETLKETDDVNSPVLKNTKANKLSNLFKSAKGKKDAAEIKKLTEELGLSSDDFDDSDADIFEESDDGLVYAKDASDEDDVVDAIETKETKTTEKKSKKIVDKEESVIAGTPKVEQTKKTTSETPKTPKKAVAPVTPKTTVTPAVAKATTTKTPTSAKKTAPSTDVDDVQVLTAVNKSTFDKETLKVKDELDKTGGIALKALAAYQTNTENEKKKLFEDEGNGVYLNLKYKLPAFVPTTKRVGSRKLYELTFPEKSPENASVCLILPDLSHTEADVKDHEYDKQARIWGDILREKFNLTGKDISKIYTMTQLRREIHTRADKNEFSRAFDIFLVDRTIYTLVLYHIGHNFQKGAHQPYPLIVTANNVPQQIKRAYSLASMDVRPGQCQISMKIGNLTQGASKLVVNLRCATECLLNNIPGGWKNLKTATITLDEYKLHLPIYVDFSPKSLVDMVKPEPAPRNIVEDELNTLDSKYRVRIDNGEIRIVDAKSGQVVGNPKAYFGDALEDVEDDGIALADEEQDFKAAPLIVKKDDEVSEEKEEKPKKVAPKAKKHKLKSAKATGPPAKKSVKA